MTHENTPIFLSLVLITAFGSCKKLDDLTTVDDGTNIPKTGIYNVHKGTVTVTTPDSTYVFTAPSDQITISGNTDYFNIVCYRDNTTSFNISSTDKPVGNATTNIYEYHFFGLYQNAIQIYSNSTTSNIGTISLQDYNFNTEAASGSFTVIGTKGGSVNVNSTPKYKVTGTFDLKLNTK